MLIEGHFLVNSQPMELLYCDRVNLLPRHQVTKGRFHIKLVCLPSFSASRALRLGINVPTKIQTADSVAGVPCIVQACPPYSSLLAFSRLSACRVCPTSPSPPVVMTESQTTYH